MIAAESAQPVPCAPPPARRSPGSQRSTTPSPSRHARRSSASPSRWPPFTSAAAAPNSSTSARAARSAPSRVAAAWPVSASASARFGVTSVAPCSRSPSAGLGAPLEERRAVARGQHRVDHDRRAVRGAGERGEAERHASAPRRRSRACRSSPRPGASPRRAPRICAQHHRREHGQHLMDLAAVLDGERGRHRRRPARRGSGTPGGPPGGRLRPSGPSLRSRARSASRNRMVRSAPRMRTQLAAAVLALRPRFRRGLRRARRRPPGGRSA